MLYGIEPFPNVPDYRASTVFSKIKKKKKKNVNIFTLKVGA